MRDFTWNAGILAKTVSKPADDVVAESPRDVRQLHFRRARPRSIASTRGGVSGISSGRLPVASAIAEATVAATLRIGTSPAPFAPSGPREGAPSWRCTSTGTTSSASGTR